MEATHRGSDVDLPHHLPHLPHHHVDVDVKMEDRDEAAGGNGGDTVRQ